MFHKLSKKEVQYWSQVFSGIANIFLGITAGTAFFGQIDLYKVSVVLFGLGLTFAFWILGWRILK